MADGLVFVIEEATGSNPIRVELADHDLPFGRPRKGGAFDLGAEVGLEEVLLDGRNSPILHTKSVDNLPTEIKGHLRDHFTGEDGRAHAIKDDLLRILNRRRALNLSIWRLKWKGFLRKAKFPFEGPNDLPYELTFRVLQGPGAKMYVSDTRKTLAPVDMMANARAVLEARRAAWLAEAMTRVAHVSMIVAFDQADEALELAEQAAQSYEEAPSRKADGPARALISACQLAKDKAQALADAAEALIPSVLRRATAGNVSAFVALQAGTSADAFDARTALLDVQTTAQARIRKATRLYRVAEGDTLESIALNQLKNAARADELGVRQQDLVVGKFIRIRSVV